MSDGNARPVDLVEHARFVRSLALHLLHHDADAEDAAQETLLRSLEHPPRRGPGLRAWTGTVLRNVIRMERRAGGRRARRERVTARAEAVRACDDAVSRAEILSRVAAAVRSLPAEDLEVVILRHYEGLPPRAIAKRLRLDVDQVKRRLRRSHDRLRSMLDEGRGGNVEDWRRALGGLLGLPAGSRPAGPLEGPGAAAVGTVASVAASKALVLVAPSLLAIGVGIWLYSTRTGGDAAGPPSAELASAPDESGETAARLAGPGRAARPPREAVAIDAPVSAAAAFRVSGRVSGPSGVPVAGALVRVHLARGEAIDETALVVSAKDGGYAAELARVPSLAPLARAVARIEVEADAPGHRPAREQRPSGALLGDGLAGLDIVLEPGSTVRGRVVSVDGRPIGGAKVGWGPSGPAVSDGDGRYALAMEPGPAQRIRVLAEGEGMGLSLPFDVGPALDTEAPDIIVRGPGSISGIARFADGSPAAGVRITAWLSSEGGDMGRDFDPQDLAPSGLFRSANSTGADGRFRIGGLAPGRYAVTDEFDPLGLHADDRYDTGATDAEVVVRMHRVRLRVEDADGRPLPGARYLARWEGNGVDEETDEILGADGTHDLWASPGDTFHVLARVGEAFSAYRRIHVHEGRSDTEALLTVRTPGDDAGRIVVKGTDATGAPLERFTLTVAPVDPSAEGFRAEGENGTATLRVAPGRYRVRAVSEDDLRDPGFLRPAEADVELAPGVTQTLELRLQVGGRLRLRVTGVPAPTGDVAVAVEFLPPSGPPWRPLSIFRSERGDSMPLGRLYVGTWATNYEVLEAGACRLRLSAPGFRAIEVPVEVRASEIVDVEVTLVP